VEDELSGKAADSQNGTNVVNRQNLHECSYPHAALGNIFLENIAQLPVVGRYN
jgi:hypothetical protein